MYFTLSVYYLLLPSFVTFSRSLLFYMYLINLPYLIDQNYRSFRHFRIYAHLPICCISCVVRTQRTLNKKCKYGSKMRVKRLGNSTSSNTILIKIKKKMHNNMELSIRV